MIFDYKKEYFRYRHYYIALTPFLKSPRAKAYTMLIFSFLAVAFFGFFAIRPTIRTIIELNRQIKDQRFLDQALEEKIKALVLAQEEYELIQKDLPLVFETLPQKANFPPFVQKVEENASNSGLTLGSFSFQAIELSPLKVGTAAASPIPFRLDIGGSYPDLFSFLKTLERSKRLVSFQNFAFKKGEGEEKDKLKLQLEGKIYLLPESQKEFKNDE